MHLEIDRSDISKRRLALDSAPPVGADEVELTLDAFALTANNISYALSGELLDYWGFFPADSGWGRLPVMGFATVTASDLPSVAVGERFFGFYPAGDRHRVLAQPTKSGFLDCGVHRERHAMAYRSFDRADPSLSTDEEHRILLLRGLFITSYLCDDFLADNSMFGAEQLVITSASSKTSLALAHEARRHARATVIGLTSPTNLPFVVDTGYYDTVLGYDELEPIDAMVPSVIVDMAGNGPLLAALHRHLGSGLRHSCRIGATHWRQSRFDGDIPGPTPAFFFAPSQISKRGREWGRDVLQRRLDEALADFVRDSHRWMHVDVTHSGEQMLSLYDRLVAGDVDPAVGNIVVPRV